MEELINSEITGDFIRKALTNCDKMVFFDLETTGLDPVECRIIEFSAVKFNVCRPTTASAPFVLKESDKITAYIKPDEPLSEDIVKITGYTDDFLADKPMEAEVFGTIRDFIPENCIVAGYNNNTFDNIFMDSLYKRNNDVFKFSYTVDVLKMARQLYKKEDVGSFKLANIAHYLGVDDGITFHKASDDTEATIRIFNVLVGKLKDELSENVLVKPFVNSVYYSNFSGNENINVNTIIGLISYDILKKHWRSSSINLSGVDLDYITERCCDAIGVSNIGELAKFRGEKRLI